jgi:hypothetical protein
MQPSFFSLKQRFGVALGVAMIFTTILATMVASLLYWANQNQKDDAERNLLQEASNACKAILGYQAAWIKQHGYGPHGIGRQPLEAELIAFLQAAFPHVNTDECELYLTKPSDPFWIYVDPANPANRNNAFMGQRVLEEVAGLLVKVPIQMPGQGPRVTLYAGLPIINTFFSYFQPVVFFDMDAEYYTNNQKGVNQVEYMNYCNGTAWCTGDAKFQNLLAANKGFRQTMPSLATSVEELNAISEKSFVYNNAWVGATTFIGRNQAVFYNTIGDSANGGSGKYSEKYYYNSLTQNAQVPDGQPTSWQGFVDQHQLWFASGNPAFPIPGFPNYQPSNPPAKTDDRARNSRSYAWALLEPPVNSSSAWHKGEGEAYKFSRNACLSIYADWQTFGGETGRTMPIGEQNFEVFNNNGKQLPSWGLSTFPAGIYPICSCQQKLADNVLQFYYNIYMFGLDENAQLKPFGGMTQPSYDKKVYTFGSSEPSPSPAYYVWSTNLESSFLSMSLPFVGSGQGPGQGPNTYISFFDPRRNGYVHALVIDVQNLYHFLRNGDPLCPGYQPDRDYNGIVYISWTGFNANPMPPQGDGLLMPYYDGINGTENCTANYGVVLMHGDDVPSQDDPAEGFTIASNVPLYVVGNYGSKAWPCMLAADAITLLSESFFQRNLPGMPLVVTTPYQNGFERTQASTHMVSGSYTWNTSLLAGVTSYGLTGNPADRGDGVFNTPRTIENFAGTDTGHGSSGDASSLAINGTIFGLFEPQVAINSVGGAPNWNPQLTTKPCAINPKNEAFPPPPPGCRFLKCNQYRLGHYEFIKEDQYKELTGED